MDFSAFPKIPRLNREVIVTEKIDGTNAQILIVDCQDARVLEQMPLASYNGMCLYAGSRNRYVTTSDDNYGFAAWCVANHEELIDGLGIGQHFGEWCGRGIQRGYGMPSRLLALFNINRWDYDNVPRVCTVVPTLTTGSMEEAVPAATALLRTTGSKFVPGYMNPEGVVVYHTAARSMFKVLLENDGQPKGLQQ